MRFYFGLIPMLLTAFTFPRAAVSGETENLKKIETLYSGYQEKFPDAPALTANELVDLLRDPKVVLVDVREPEEQRVSMIFAESHTVVARAEFEKIPQQYKDWKVIVYCTIGYRSGLYTSKLRGQGFHAFNLNGGILAWVNLRLPVVDNRGKRIRRVHVYGRKWNLAPAGYEAVW